MDHKNLIGSENIMNNIAIFPSYNLPNGTKQNDKLLLDEIIKIRDNTKSKYTNFSYFDYSQDIYESIHYVTYPINWITHYIKTQSLNIDPLMKLDYRLISIVDWHDIQSSEEATKLFQEFTKFNLGNCGISIISPLKNNRYGSLSMSFDMPREKWLKFRNEKISYFNILGSKITNKYESIFNNMPYKKYSITKREQECLYWVARGKTDEQISSILSIGKWTVVSHLKSAKYKLCTSNRSSTIAKAISLRIIELDHQ